MADTARNTYDATKQYRRVVPQQGRVLLEADLNEASELQTEAARREVIDVVGPAGVPSDPVSHAAGTGYAITAPVAATRDFAIGAGAIYAGGWRVVQADPALRYTTQADWLDRPLAVPASPTEAIYLRLREHDVSAVEDTTLREVALGGPDTAQRVRLVRHVERAAVKAPACSAFGEQVAAWAALGLVYSAADLSLVPGARLAVSPEPLGSAPGPCDPAALSGYLGAENQQIRVQLASATQLVWAYDNGSAVYRVDLDSTDATHRTLVLRTAPVDAFHQPRIGQVVELLRAAVDLGPGLGGADYAAAPTGFVTTLASAFVPDTGTLVVADALPAELLDPAQTRAVFLRVWENRAAFTAGTAVPLVDRAGSHTGLQVTLSAPPFVAGSFWSFAVRPATPQAIDPVRYAAPQPPDGPREWVCPLGVIDWTKAPPAVTDCRPGFDDLVTLTAEVDELIAAERNTGCCTVTLAPGDLSDKRTLQMVVDHYQAVLKIGTRVTICLGPGVYELRAPLRLGPDHSGIAIEGCHGGAVIQAAPGTELGFLDGLIVLVHANEVTLRGLRFHLPEVPFARAGGRIADLPYARIGSDGAELQQLAVSIAIRPVHAAELTIEDCLFRYQLAEQLPMFAAAIFAGSECWGLRLYDNKFVMQDGYLRDEPQLTRLLYGYVLAPTATVALGGATTGPLRGAVTGGSYLRPLLTEVHIRGNLFSGLIAATLVFADIGAIRLEDNRVRDCYGGFWTLSTASLFDDRSSTSDGPDLGAFRSDPIVQTTLIMAVGYPAPAGLPASDFQQVTLAVTRLPNPPTTTLPAPRPNPTIPTIPTTKGAAAPDAAAGKPEAAAQFAVSDELALAIRFAAATRNAALSLGETIGPVIGVVAEQAFKDDQRDVQLLALHVGGNDVDARVAGIATSAALVAWDDERAPNGSLVVTANRFASASIAQVTALIIGPRRIAITGNLVTNDTTQMTTDGQLRTLLAQLASHGRAVAGGDAKPSRVADLIQQRFCLAVMPVLDANGGGALVAITGNVFEGQIAVPARPQPFPPWNFLNTQV